MLEKILKFKFKILGGVVLTFMLVQLISAYFFGYITENTMNTQFKDFTNTPLIKVIHRDYHRGIFSSDSNVELAVNSSIANSIQKFLPLNNNESTTKLSNNTYSIKYTTHIEHGLFAGALNGYFIPTIAYVKTDIIYPEKVKKILSKFFVNKPPLTIENVIYLDKSGRYTIYSPKFSYDESVSGVKVVWGGMKMTIKYNSTYTAFVQELALPLCDVIVPTKGSAHLSYLILTSNTKKSIHGITVGSMDLRVADIKVQWEDHISTGLKIGDILWTLTGINLAEFLNSIDVIDPDSFMFTNITYTSSTQDVNNFFSANADVHFESLVTQGKTYGPMNLNLGIEHVSSPEFGQLIDAIEKLSTQIATQKDKESQVQGVPVFIKTLKEYVGPIMVNKPIIKLGKFNLKTPNGTVTVSGYASTNGFVLEDMQDQGRFMQKLLLDINVSIPKPVLYYLFILQMRYLLNAVNMRIDVQSTNSLNKVVNILLDNQVNVWTKKGFITNDHGIIATHMSIKNGKLFLNGHKAK